MRALTVRLDAPAALIHVMVLVSAADRNMTDAEVRAIGEVVSYLPIFRGFDRATLPALAAGCVDRLSTEDGLDRELEAIAAALPAGLRETAYAVACDIAAADGVIGQEVLRFLEILRHRLNLDRLVAAAIERGARARHRTG